MALAAVELKNIHVTFGQGSRQQQVFSGINMSVAEGESVVLIGPSGQGKSVLLKLMAGLLQPQVGEVLIRGENWTKVSSAKKHQLQRSMGMLFQKNALFDSLTCGENIAFPLREITTFSESEIQKIVDDFLEAVGISHAKNLFPDEISGGMQKRLGIARALALKPGVIFYDDPTAGLDPITSRKIIELIMRLHLPVADALPVTMVTITNDMNRAYQMADRIYLVTDHEVIDAGTVRTIHNHSDLRVRNFISGQSGKPIAVPA